MPLTDFERGQLTLQAFGLMDGWGKRNERDVFIPHTLDVRKQAAKDLVEWAIAQPEKDGE